MPAPGGGRGRPAGAKRQPAGRRGGLQKGVSKVIDRAVGAMISKASRMGADGLRQLFKRIDADGNGAIDQVRRGARPDTEPQTEHNGPYCRLGSNELLMSPSLSRWRTTASRSPRPHGPPPPTPLLPVCRRSSTRP